MDAPPGDDDRRASGARHAGRAEAVPAVAIVCADGSVLKLDADDGRAIPILAVASALCRALLDTTSSPPLGRR